MMTAAAFSTACLALLVVTTLCQAFILVVPTTTLRPAIGRSAVFPSLLRSSSSSSSCDNTNKYDDDDGRIDVTQDDRLYRVRLSRATGIDWGTDLSFCFVYVLDLDPTGDAARSGVVKQGDQLCELIAVAPSDNNVHKPINLVGASFDNVMTALSSLDRTVQELDLVFFRGSKDELKAAATGSNNDDAMNASGDPSTITVTVVQNKGSADESTITLQAPAGTNLRQLLIDNDINVYQSLTRWTNCKGKQLCGTCIVNVVNGAPNTNWKSMDEASTLRANPDSYRLSCITFCHGDVTVETFPPINADQWTR